jgi:predicted Fe-Mo cluster-binding NifX family protein
MSFPNKRTRLAVAEEANEDFPAPRLGRAVKFALFDVVGNDIRGPFYRIRHDDPGTACDSHAQLVNLLHDCSVVIAGAVGPQMARRMHELGIHVVVTSERKPAARLVARLLAGTLEEAGS